MVRQTAKILFLEIFGALLLLLLIAAVAAVIRLASGPIQLKPFQDDVERAIAATRDGQPVEMEALWLAWSPDERRIVITAEGLDLKTFDDVTVASADTARIDLDATALFLGKVKVKGIDLEDGSLRVSHLGGDLWNIGGETVTIAIPASETVDLRAIVGRINGFVDSLFTTLQRESEDETLNINVRVSNFSVDIYDSEGTLIAEIPSLEGSLGEDADGTLTLAVDASSPGFGLPERLGLVLSTPTSRDSLELSISLSDWSLEGLMARLRGDEPVDEPLPAEPGAPETEPSGTNAPEAEPVFTGGLPLSGSFTLSALQEGGLQSLGWSLDLKDGELNVGGRAVELTSAAVEGQLDTTTETMELKVRNLDTPRVKGDADIVFEDVFDSIGSGPVPFTLKAPDLTVDATPFFETVWRLRGVDARGALDAVAGVLTVERISTSLNGMKLRARSTLRWRGDDFEGAEGPPLAVHLALDMDGPVDRTDALTLWPVHIGGDGRVIVADSFEAGKLSDITLRLDLEPGVIQDGIMADDAFDLDFQVSGARYRFLKDIPPGENGFGRAHVTGNAFVMDVTRARVSNWDIAPARIEISRFKPEGGTLTVTATGSGPVRDMLQVLQDSELQLGKEEGFDPARASGEARAEAWLQRPVGADVPQEEFQYRVSGSFTGGGMADAFQEFDLTDSRGMVDVTPERVVVEGNGTMAGSSVRYTLTEQLGEGIEQPSRLEANAIVTPDVLNRFGVFARAYLAGEVPMSVVAVGKSPNFDEAHLDFDFTGSRIEVSEIGLLKPLGAEAHGQMVYRAATPARPAFYSGTYTSGSAEVDGDVRLTPDGKVDIITLRRLYVASRMDVSGEIARDRMSGVRISLTGDYLDATGVISGAGMMSEAAPPVSGEDGEDTAPEGNLYLQADVLRLTLGEGLDVRNAALTAEIQDGALNALSAAGETAPGQNFSAELTRSLDGVRSVKLAADDAGFVLRAMFQSDLVEGGRLTLEGTLGQGTTPTRLRLNLYDTRLRKAPLFTQILSLASLQGLADTLSGEGVLFTRVDVPLAILDKRFIIDGGRASGPALGLTVNGTIDLGEARSINLEGVLVPSFGVNSALGGIPIIGDLFVSRRGEGVFSVRYDVKGTLDKAQVTANLLSAITPGVLRRIFENPADADIEAIQALEAEAEEGGAEPTLPPPPPAEPVPAPSPQGEPEDGSAEAPEEPAETMPEGTSGDTPAEDPPGSDL